MKGNKEERKLEKGFKRQGVERKDEKNMIKKTLIKKREKTYKLRCEKKVKFLSRKRQRNPCLIKMNGRVSWHSGGGEGKGRGGKEGKDGKLRIKEERNETKEGGGF